MQLKKPQTKSEGPYPSLTVVVPARNEEKNIAACLQSILANNYRGKLEVVVVDDHSEDSTAAIVSSFERVRLISLKDFVSSPINAFKKKAIETAIAQTSGEMIVCTDADCVVQPHWLNSIGNYYHQHGFQFLAMPVKIDTGDKPSFLTIFQSLDLMTYQGLTAASIHANKPMLCNGANLAYTREAFNSVNGFKDIQHIASGDDVLLMHKIDAAFPRGVAFLKASDTIVQTAAMPTVGEFLQQRIRWASKATQYKKFTVTLVAAIVWLFNLCLLIFPIFLLGQNKHLLFSGFSISAGLLWLICLALKILVEAWYLNPVAGFFSEKKLMPWFFVAQPLHIIYTVAAGLLGLFGSYRWKGRMVK